MQIKKNEIENLILQHAINEFEKNGYRNATIRDIAANSGVSTGNIYRYFISKKDIFRSVIQPVYHSLSSLVFDLYKNETYSAVDISGIAQQVSRGIMNVYRQHQRELMILIDKNIGSPYENFVHTLINMVNDRIKKELVLMDDQSHVISYVISSGFVNGIFVILRQYKDIELAQEAIRRTTLFFFDDLQNRLGSNELA